MPSFFQHAHALELLSDKLIDGARALDVGSGSGYLTACMALMVRKNKLNVSVDQSEIELLAHILYYYVMCVYVAKALLPLLLPKVLTLI
jgi:predicted RNA methylase